MSFRGNPLDSSPARALNLQKYLLLHSEHEALLTNLTSLPTHNRRPSYPTTPYPPADAAADADEHWWLTERKLHDVNQQIKTALTDLLNCESVRGDRLYRAWVQRRLMEAEREMRQGRRMSGAAGMGVGVRRWGGEMGEVRMEGSRA